MNSIFEFIYKTKHNQLWHCPPHSHNYYEIVYFTKGTGIVSIDGKDYEYSPNTLSVVKPSSLRSEQHHTLTSTWCVGLFSNAVTCNIKNDFLHDTKSKKILNIFLSMYEEMTEKYESYKEMLEHLAEQLVILILRMQNEEHHHYGDFVKVIKMIEEHYDEDIDLNALADMTNYSYHHFRHTFKKITGVSPKKYIVEKRLDQAKRLLRDGNYSVSYISQICGFSSNAQFNHIFKNNTNTTPGEYKKRFQK